jgi:hypothetical protein
MMSSGFYAGASVLLFAVFTYPFFKRKYSWNKLRITNYELRITNWGENYELKENYEYKITN